MKKKKIVKRLIKLRELFFEEMERAGKESGSQVSYKVGDDFQGLGEIRESGAIGVHEKSVECGRCSSMCLALNELQLAICEIRGDPESHWKKGIEKIPDGYPLDEPCGLCNSDMCGAYKKCPCR